MAFSFYILIGILLVVFVVLPSIRVPIISNPATGWHHPLLNFNYSTLTFYSNLRKYFDEKKVPTIRGMRVVHMASSHMFSRRRKYFRIVSEDFSIDVCASPYGDDYFFSYWLLERVSLWRLLIKKLPVIGTGLEKQFWPMKYHRIDSMQMYLNVVHAGIMEVIDSVTDEKGISRISAEDRKPSNKNILQRK